MWRQNRGLLRVEWYFPQSRGYRCIRFWDTELVAELAQTSALVILQVRIKLDRWYMSGLARQDSCSRFFRWFDSIRFLSASLEIWKDHVSDKCSVAWELQARRTVCYILLKSTQLPAQASSAKYTELIFRCFVLTSKTGATIAEMIHPKYGNDILRQIIQFLLVSFFCGSRCRLRQRRFAPIRFKMHTERRKLGTAVSVELLRSREKNNFNWH